MTTQSKFKGTFFFLFLLAFQLFCSGHGKISPLTLTQFPSPMIECTRSHQRVSDEFLPGQQFQIDSLFANPVEIFLPSNIFAEKSVSLLLHFHGTSEAAKFAVSKASQPFVLVNINLGSGSSKYEQALLDKKIFSYLLKKVERQAAACLENFKQFDKIVISSFSAGYGAVRAIIHFHENIENIDGIILLDGLHTDYIPDRLVIARGGKLNVEKLKDFQTFAELAADGKKKLLIAHSEIFPGTYASTTETADYLIQSLRLKRTPVLNWGPMGMQQVSEVRKNKFWVFGYAGNSAPDHVDFLHGLSFFLNFMLEN